MIKSCSVLLRSSKCKLLEAVINDCFSWKWRQMATEICCSLNQPQYDYSVYSEKTNTNLSLFAGVIHCKVGGPQPTWNYAPIEWRH
jgi:hypothetical protein